jgi:ABC-type tungstate transport system permease subunit
MKFVIFAITLLSLSSIVINLATSRTVKNTGFFDVLLGKSSEFKKSIKNGVEKKQPL